MSLGVKSFFAFFYKTTVDLVIYTLIIVSIIGLLPNNWFTNFPFHPTSYEVNFSDKLDNWNNLLSSKGELLLKNQIVGPESLAISNDSIYTGLIDGRLVAINKKTLKVKEITKFQNQAICGKYSTTIDLFKLIPFGHLPDDTKPSECGRVLGVKFGTDGQLYAVDYYKGLYRINLMTSTKELVGKFDDTIYGYDDVEFDPNKNIAYVSVLSTKWTLYRCAFGMFEPDNSGYLAAFDLDSKKSFKLRTGLLFPNGIQLSKDKKHIFMAETASYRVLRISLQSIHKAIKENRELTDTEIETFARVPGEPDNVRMDSNGDLLVALYSTRKDGKVLHDYISGFPIVRKAIARTVHLFGVAINYVNSNLLNSPSLQKVVIELYTGGILVEKIPKSGSIVRLDAKSGQIKNIYGSDQFNAVTEGVIDNEGDLYFGSFVSPFLGRLKKQHLN